MLEGILSPETGWAPSGTHRRKVTGTETGTDTSILIWLLLSWQMHFPKCPRVQIIDKDRTKPPQWFGSFFSAFMSDYLCAPLVSYSNPLDNVSQKMFINNHRGPREGNNWHSHPVAPVLYPSPEKSNYRHYRPGDGIGLQDRHSSPVSECIVLVLSHRLSQHGQYNSYIWDILQTSSPLFLQVWKSCF